MLSIWEEFRLSIPSSYTMYAKRKTKNVHLLVKFNGFAQLFLFVRFSLMFSSALIGFMLRYLPILINCSPKHSH